jgi:hypothetical protein
MTPVTNPINQVFNSNHADVVALARISPKAGTKEILSGVDLSAAVEWDKRRNHSTKWAEHYAGVMTHLAIERCRRAQRLLSR